MKFIVTYKDDNEVFNNMINIIKNNLEKSIEIDFKSAYQCLNKALKNPDEMWYIQSSSSLDYFPVKCEYTWGNSYLYYYYFDNEFDKLETNYKLKLLKYYSDLIIQLWDYYDYIYNYLTNSIIDKKGYFLKGLTFNKPVREHPQTLFAWIHTIYNILNNRYHDYYKTDVKQFFRMEELSLWLDYLRLMLLPVFGKNSLNGLFKYLTGKLDKEKTMILDYYINFVDLGYEKIIIWHYLNKSDEYKDSTVQILSEYEWKFLLKNLKDYSLIIWGDL